MASITTCPHCHMRVLPRPDGSCPSCNGLIKETDSPAPVKRTAAATVKPGPKGAARRKSGTRAGRAASSSAPSAKEIEPLYEAYRSTAVDIWQMSVRAVYPYLIAGIILFLAMVAVSFTTWQQDLVEPQVRAPGPTTWLLILIGFVVMIALIVVGLLQGNRLGNLEIRDLAQEKPGLPAFYRAYVRHAWPKEGMISGPALDKFLTMLGNK
jgi:hypothetical protein